MEKAETMKLLELIAEAMNVYVIAAAAVAYVCVWLVLQRVWLRPRRLEQWLRAQGLKGNPYRLWYGDSKDMAAMVTAVQSKPIGWHDDIAPYALPFLHRTITTHGKRSYIWEGPNPIIMIMEPDMIKDVFQKYQVFVKLNSNPFNTVLLPGLIAYEGEKWAKHRHFLNPSFTVAKLKDMVPTMQVCCNELVEKLQETMASNTRSHEVDVWPFLSNFTADIISRTAFGSNYEQGQKIFLLQREQAELIVKLERSLLHVMGFSFSPTKMSRRIKKINEEMVDVIRGIVQKKVDRMKSADKINSDLLGILLESNRKEVEENGDNREMGITIDEVVAECKLFYFAGQETTSNLLVWAIVMLSIHQKWQREAREEIFEVFGKNIPDYDGLHQLKKVNMILHEVLRLYPPAAVIRRKLLKNIKLGDIDLPSGVGVILPLLLIHHDKNIWGEDAKEFKPERFAQGVAKATKGQLAAFFPFSLGPRICIGMNFAMIEAKLALVTMLQSFSFELSPNYEHAPVPLVTLRPEFGVKIMLSQI